MIKSFRTKKTKAVLFAIFTIALGAAVVRATKTPILETTTFSTRILDSKGRMLRLTLSGDERYRLFTPIEQVPQNVIETVLMHEDRYFRFHPGLNPMSLAKAFMTTYVNQSRRVGGSTITMQLARMTSTRGSKTIGGKLHQIARALWLEATHSKDEILEAYLNLLPYGGNVEGLGAASLVYFGKDPKDLTLTETLSLAVIPQNPNVRGQGSASESFQVSRMKLFEEWVSPHPEDHDSLVDLKLPIKLKGVRRLPFRAPHFTDTVLDRSRSRSWRESASLVTTLDGEMQSRLEAKIKTYVKEKSRQGIVNAAAMVIDTTSMSVRAQVGSADFFDHDIDGQVNGALAKRSPGSALKPFTYALALDQGLIHPLSLLKDTPMSFGGFDPENFDKGFEGPIRARDALTSSRNVPAVFLASQLKAPSLFTFMKDAGVKRLKEERHYGLALTLGGAEVTMEELSQLYAGLANKGVFKPLRYLQNADTSSGTALLSPEAAFLVLDMLRTNARDNESHLDSWARDSVPIAWKTGTSYGFRDAWTAGVMGNYVIVVWLGNFEGQSNPALIGRELAAPLFFQIADALRSEADKEPTWLDTRELNVKKVDVCALSGHLPNDHCKHRVRSWFIPGKSPISTCDIHREIKITRAGFRACEDSTGDIRKEVYEFWPSDLLQLFRRAGIPRRSPPAFESGCRASDSVAGLPPQITSPRAEVAYTLRLDDERQPASREGIPLIAVADGDARRLHWFIGPEYVGESSPQRPLMWKPRPGRHVVRVLDDQGRSDSRTLDVEITR